MYQKYKDKAEFLFVYIREAHPEDGWQIPKNKKDGVVYHDPKSYEERLNIARLCTKSLVLTLPTVVDRLDDSVSKAYGAWPERLYVVGKNGKIAYKGGPGPFQYKPDELEKFLEEYLSKPENRTSK